MLRDMISVYCIQCNGVQCTVLQAMQYASHSAAHKTLSLETIADWEAGDLSMSHCCQPTNEKKPNKFQNVNQKAVFESALKLTDMA